FKNAAAGDRSLLFRGLRQQDYKLVTAVAKRKIDEAKVLLDDLANFAQQLAANQVAVGVVHLLEAIEVKEDHAEFIAEARRTIDLRIERLIQMPRVEQPGAIVGYSQLLNALYRTRIIDGDGRKVT